VENLGMVTGDKPHAAHICGERINLVYLSCSFQTVRPSSQVEYLKLIGVAGVVFRTFNIHASHPITPALEITH
jgi:hypothetical protein